MDFICFYQPYMAVNPGTCIPAAVQSFINDFYGDCIGNAGGITVFINVDSERNISVGIETCLLSVYPYFRLVVSTFKIEGEDFVRISRLEDQFFSVPCGKKDRWLYLLFVRVEVPHSSHGECQALSIRCRWRKVVRHLQCIRDRISNVGSCLSYVPKQKCLS